jgi:hypothetical protein
VSCILAHKERIDESRYEPILIYDVSRFHECIRIFNPGARFPDRKVVG